MARPSPKTRSGKAKSRGRDRGTGRKPAGNVAERERAQRALRDSKEQFRATFEQAAVGVAHTTVDGRFLQVNRKLRRMFGYSAAELLDLTTRDLTHPDDRGSQRPLRKQLLGGQRQFFAAEKRYLRRDGTVVWVNRTVTLAGRPAAGKHYLIQVFEDITKRKRTEERLARLTRARRVMAECNHVLIHADEERGMLESMCRIVVESGGYKMAWVGYPTDDGRQPVSAVAHAGFGGDAPMTAPVAWSTDGRYQGFMSEVIATGNPNVARDILNDPRLARRRGRAMQHGFQSSIGLPLKGQGGILGAIAIYASEADAFDEEEIALLTGLVDDIAYGIINLRNHIARAEAEERSRETERRFREMFEQAAVGMTRVDLDGHVVDSNQKFCDMLGYSREELLGKAIRDITHPDDYGPGSGYRAQLVQGAAKSRSGEKRFLRKDGSVMWARRTMSTACDADGKPRYVISVVEDITERKQTDELYRATFDDAPVGIMHTRVEDDRILHANPRFSEMVGYTGEELLRLSTDDLLAPEGRGTDRGQYRDRMLGGELNTYTSERKFVRKDGTTFWGNRTVSLVRDASGKPDYFIRVIEDITERVLASQRLAMEHAVTQLLAESAAMEDAMPKLLQTICQAMEWAYGARWSCDLEKGIERVDYWADFEPDFDPADREWWLRQGVQGSVVLLHRAWRHNEPTWVVDIGQHPRFRRAASSRKFGLNSAYAFPITAGGTVIGVMEFFSREVRQPDEMLLKVALSIGAQIGQFIRRKEAEQALTKSEERYRDVFEASPLPMWAWDDETLRIVAVNQAAIDHYGYSREEFLRITVRDIWEPTDQTRYEQHIRGRTSQPYLYLERHRTRDGRVIDTEVTARRLTMDGRPVWLTLVNDVSERKRAEAALRESEEQFRQLAGNIPQAFWIADTSMQRTLYISRAAEVMLGRPLEKIVADRRALIRAVHSEDRERVHAARKAAAASGYDETYRIVRPNGSIRWVRDRAFPVRDSSGAVYRVAGIAEDITDRKEAEERLLHLAHYDVLTGLPNRALFYDRLRQALAQARRNQWITGVMFMDVDRFKNINDTLGHAVGDRLLQQVAERLINAVRAEDTVGRLGGDEFAMVLSNLGGAQNARRVAQKIMTAFNEPFRLEGAEVFVTSSIGITLYPQDSADQDTLIKNADAAMYRAKEAGRNAYQFYTPEMSERGAALLNLEGGLRRALEREEFLLYYQPKAGVKTGALTGFEALLRWRHPERGLVLPDEFIPVLEETGLIVQVGEWVLNAVCEQINEWTRAGLDPAPVAINLSARQFLARELGSSIKRILDRHRIDPALLELEITESSLMVNPEEATRTLEYLKSLGVGISIDDFGTGYSSLGYLKRFPLDSLKVDRSFVRDVTTDADDATITRAVITMAHALGLAVIAEGVETESQLAFLVENGCDQIQGFYLARPQPAEDCTRSLIERRLIAGVLMLKKA
jgi:diguanylate cyclase (GGDEF)-like protein/PAS domain S-box-containing protein